ncbi:MULTISPECIES: hydantoinase B/oxoprolinase family protein [unclassified Dehalobacter]|jgi:N-methylhydantoinase B|uniref:hydantoinase B/oxoprolinase family protein n=1 Tax=unclassified Dehalobacter TaxID=2635733 RepID=UPI000302AE31|nr:MULTISPECIES: hydantoinase B/oxoprolinase family protein [unclassified Dehalobacter]MCG1025167.1 hydantoinase B/oxoprolinase family protein [Dehalobacter sp.]OCZ49395.1 hydantoinase [Dehalobacter sp. TeCB1]
MTRTNTEELINRTVIANRLDSITKEMGLALEHSAHSPIFAEACDFACCICDKDGELVSQLSGIPILATAGSFSVQSVLRKYKDNIKNGDVFIINDPYDGGNHLPDIGIITPVFFKESLMFFCVSRAHHGDIGGSTAGSYNPKATEIFQEGIRIPPTKLMCKNEFISEVLDMILINTRNPNMLKSDLLAQIGANKVAAKRIMEMVEAYTPAVVNKAIAETLEQTEMLTRKRIREVPDGIYRATEYIDDDGYQEEPVKIEIAVKVEGDRLLVDFEGTDKQVKGFINTSVVTATTASGIAVLWFLGSDIPRNGGAFRCIDVHLPKGSLVNPYEPAPVTLCTLTPASEIIGTIFQALGQAVPGMVPAGYARYAGPSYYGKDPRNDRYYVGFSFCSTGSGGAMKGSDGKSYMSAMSNFGGVRTPNIESNEIQYPHITRYHEMETDTAGAGEYRGGAGMRYAFELYDEGSHIVNFGDGMKFAPYGLNGGHEGSLNKGVFLHTGKPVIMESKEAPRRVAKGDQVILNSSGGGGWGNPFDRPAEKVYDDVLDEIITIKTAVNIYGVVITEEGIDYDKTNRLRNGKKLCKN